MDRYLPQHRGRARGFLRRPRRQRQPREFRDDERAYHSPKLNFIFGPFDKTEYFLNYGQGFHSNDARGTTVRPTRPGAGQTRGEEIGVRTEMVPRLQSSLSLWRLTLDSELVFAGDAGTTQASRPSLRRGIEWSNRYIPRNWCSSTSTFRRRVRNSGTTIRLSQLHSRRDRPRRVLGRDGEGPRPLVGDRTCALLRPAPLIEDNSQRSQSLGDFFRARVLQARRKDQR